VQRGELWWGALPRTRRVRPWLPAPRGRRRGRSFQSERDPDRRCRCGHLNHRLGRGARECPHRTPGVGTQEEVRRQRVSVAHRRQEFTSREDSHASVAHDDANRRRLTPGSRPLRWRATKGVYSTISLHFRGNEVSSATPGIPRKADRYLERVIVASSLADMGLGD